MRYILIVCLLILTACNAPVGTPVTEFTPMPESTLAPVHTETATVPPESTATALPTSPPASPPPATEVKDRPFSATLVRMFTGPFILLGGTENGEWLSPESTVSRLSGGETYQGFMDTGPTGTIKGNLPKLNPPCRQYQVETDSYPAGGRAVAITGGWNAVPRTPQDISNNQDLYVEEIRQWLIGKGFSEPTIKINQILRVDMEGDGTDEVLISASNFVEPTGHTVQLGDYSLVVMRKVTGNTVETLPVVGDYYDQYVENQFPLTYRSLFVADLNDDGILEILVGATRWEGNGVLAYEVKGTEIHEIYNLSCGL
ncbi:MAG: hypothetical protein IPP66_01965 [Anaerolineales bacterium]|nr:hypothetical protein [Anaerolineales bacterium]